MTSGRGALIVLEGCDRVGKSTQAKLLVENLVKSGISAKLMNFPDRSTAVGKILDQYLKKTQELDDHAVHLLFSANRWEAVKTMEQQLKSGTTLVLDRYSDSGVAFSAAKGLNRLWCCSCDAGLPQPDLVLYLHLNTDQAMERGGFGQERYEKEHFQNRVRHNFSLLTQDYWLTVPAEKKSVDQLQEELMQYVRKVMETAKDQPLKKLYQELENKS